MKEGGRELREAETEENVGFFFFFQKHSNRVQTKVFIGPENRPEPDPKSKIIRK